MASVVALVFEVAGRNRKRTQTTRFQTGKPIAASLGVVALALLAVGLVSDTLVIHLVQITPLVAVAALTLRSQGWGADAAVPLLAFWLVVMGGIWLFLFGVSEFLSGTFSPVEVILTIVIGLASLAGLALASATQTNASGSTLVAVRALPQQGVGPDASVS
jgi:hypothetical protein